MMAPIALAIAQLQDRRRSLVQNEPLRIEQDVATDSSQCSAPSAKSAAPSPPVRAY
jgi:hypothetical protein